MVSLNIRLNFLLLLNLVEISAKLSFSRILRLYFHSFRLIHQRQLKMMRIFKHYFYLKKWRMEFWVMKGKIPYLLADMCCTRVFGTKNTELTNQIEISVEVVLPWNCKIQWNLMLYICMCAVCLEKNRTGFTVCDLGESSIRALYYHLSYFNIITCIFKNLFLSWNNEQ